MRTSRARAPFACAAMAWAAVRPMRVVGTVSGPHEPRCSTSSQRSTRLAVAVSGSFRARETSEHSWVIGPTVRSGRPSRRPDRTCGGLLPGSGVEATLRLVGRDGADLDAGDHMTCRVVLLAEG